MAVENLKELSLDELSTKVNELRKEHLNLRIQLGAGRLAQKHKVTETRRGIARVLTEMRAKQEEK